MSSGKEFHSRTTAVERVSSSLQTISSPSLFQADLVYYLGLKPALHGRKVKVLPLDHQCLLKYQESLKTVLLMEDNSLNKHISLWLWLPSDQ